MKLLPESAECFVLTYVAGALSSVGHDLKLRVAAFEVHVDDESKAIRATFDPSSLEVECAMKHGQETRGKLSADDKKKIVKNIRKDALHPSEHPEIRFESSEVEARDGSHRVRGQLTLHGTTKEIGFDVRQEGEQYVAEVSLNQQDFGITPYKAPLGVLKVKPDVKVLFRGKPAG